ncbi:hypothetical protein AWC38_SpisGene8865 [Stylophora pistillata]|uniref:Uncharacterized protein n=1 Tax=Stylophora pistillata TaxID=50429 RepID=A0A2B4S9A2_STYPI|nr:hypothetical protein AWC38_SpisGene8865 [Stylophora pistillata]
MTSYIGKPEERPSKINNHNNVLETSLFTSDGIVLSTTQEMHCGDFVLTEDTDNHAADAEIEGSEKHVTVTIHRSSLKNYRAEECKERILANCADEHGAAASESPAKVKENETFSNDEAIFEQDGPLSLKERISNVDMSIEWIKGELTLMQAQDLSLRQQFEKLFKDQVLFRKYNVLDKTSLKINCVILSPFGSPEFCNPRESRLRFTWGPCLCIIAMRVAPG